MGDLKTTMAVGALAIILSGCGATTSGTAVSTTAPMTGDELVTLLHDTKCPNAPKIGAKPPVDDPYELTLGQWPVDKNVDDALRAITARGDIKDIREDLKLLLAAMIDTRQDMLNVTNTGTVEINRAKADGGDPGNVQRRYIRMVQYDVGGPWQVAQKYLLAELSGNPLPEGKVNVGSDEMVDVDGTMKQVRQREEEWCSAQK